MSLLHQELRIWSKFCIQLVFHLVLLLVLSIAINTKQMQMNLDFF